MEKNERDQARLEAAENAYDDYEFGEDVSIASAPTTWDTTEAANGTYMRLRCKLEFDVAGEGVLVFTVHFPADSIEPSSVGATLADSGEEIGSPGSKASVTP